MRFVGHDGLIHDESAAEFQYSIVAGRCGTPATMYVLGRACVPMPKTERPTTCIACVGTTR